VSFVAGVVTDKFCYHQPLYRQHQRMGDNGIRVSRPWLTQLTHAALSLLEPVYTAQLESIARAGSRPWTRPRSRPAAAARAR
jgi:hypothetical protein